MRKASTLALLMLLAVSPLRVLAQERENALSSKEIEQLRESAYVPDDRVRVFISFLELRIKEIEDLVRKPRRAGREEDLHDLMEQFNSIAEEFSDNLDEYGRKHRDIRKSLTKVLAATEHWASTLRTPPDDDAYNVVRKLALETIGDVREQTTQLIPDQKAWFLAHPPPKDSDKHKPE